MLGGLEVDQRWTRGGLEVDQRWTRAGLEVDQRWTRAGLEVDQRLPGGRSRARRRGRAARRKEHDLIQECIGGRAARGKEQG